MILKNFRYALITLAISAIFALPILSQENNLIAHEWGTFTSIAGRNGVSLDWRPLKEKSDLPKFVYTTARPGGLRGTYRDPGKGRLAKVRMETPVIYFYTPDEMEIDVGVGFPEGGITEWYPQAGWVNGRHESGINWGKVKLLPNENPQFLRESSKSHYYPARETDAVTIQVCNADKTKIEKEKFLFYRGIGNFGLPLAVTINGDELKLVNNGAEEIKNLIIFENKGGKIGFRFIDSLDKEAAAMRPETNQDLDLVLEELERVLISEGLYQKEAKAMIKTWLDSWFEEGLRVFYILPRQQTDKVLPLSISPQPKETVRVLVGRTEIITPEMKSGVKKEVGRLGSKSSKIRSEARKNLKEYGRFYEPILRDILETEKNAIVRSQIRRLINLS